MKKLLPLLLLPLLQTCASAVSYTNQIRSLEATATVSEATTDSKSTTSLGFWSKTVHADRFLGGGGTATANATQNSNIDDPGITTAGTLVASATSAFPETPIASASASSSLATDFQL